MKNILLALAIALAPLLCPAASLDLQVTQVSQSSSVDLYGGGYTDWALWGATNGSGLTASYSKGVAPTVISYTLGNLTNGNPLRAIGPFAVSQPFVIDSGVDSTTYAGIQHDGQPERFPRVGEGFTLSYTPTSVHSVLSVWLGTHNGYATISAAGSDYTFQSVTTAPDLGTRLYRTDIEVNGLSPVSFSVTLGGEVVSSLASGNVFVSAAAAIDLTPNPVPEISPSGVGPALALVLGFMSLVRRRV